VALTATVHTFEIALSDVDRSVYETLDLRVAQHPSETSRWMVTRTLAYCLSYEEGIAFSRGGLSDTEEPPVSIRDATGRLVAWIDVGAPSVDRLHKASKLARVAVYTTDRDRAQLARLTAGQTIHKADAVEVWTLETAFVDALAVKVDRRTRLDLTRTEGSLYAVIGGATLESTLGRTSLATLRDESR
jgi:uncharacterized protein YaeQ